MQSDLSDADFRIRLINRTKIHGAFIQVSLVELLLSQPASGLGATVFSGRQFVLFVWQIPQLMPENATLQVTFYLVHEYGAWALGTLIAGHAAAALIHHFVLRDDVLQCMAPVIKTERHKQTFMPGRIIRNQHL